MTLEADVLGKIFIDNSIMNRTILNDYHFEYERNANIFKMCKLLHHKGHDITPVAFLNVINKEKLEDKIGFKYLLEVSNAAATVHDFEHREKDIIENWKKRHIKQILQDAMFKIQTDNNLTSLPSYIQQVNELYGEGEKEEFNLISAMANAYDRYSNKELIKGINTGYYSLDKILNGLMRKEYIVIGARPGVGKTAFAINIMNRTLKTNKNSWCYMFSLEMSEDELMDREFANHSGISLQRLTSKEDLTGDEINKLSTISGEMGQVFSGRLYINDKAGSTMQDVWTKVSRYKDKQPKDSHGIVLIDYLTLLHMGGKFSNRYEEVSEISRSLKRLAKELDVTVIAVAQLNRGNENRQNKKPVISDLRESGQIEQDANTIILLYREDYYDKESDKKTIECIVEKNRRGPTGTVELLFEKELMKFNDITYRR